MQYNQNLELIQQQIAELQKLSQDHEINESKLIDQVFFSGVKHGKYGFFNRFDNLKYKSWIWKGNLIDWKGNSEKAIKIRSRNKSNLFFSTFSRLWQ